MYYKDEYEEIFSTLKIFVGKSGVVLNYILLQYNIGDFFLIFTGFILWFQFLYIER